MDLLPPGALDDWSFLLPQALGQAPGVAGPTPPPPAPIGPSEEELRLQRKRKLDEEVQQHLAKEQEKINVDLVEKLKKRRQEDPNVAAFLEFRGWDEEKAVRLGYKSRLCQFFEKGGQCHKELLCPCAHGKHELLEAPKKKNEASTFVPMLDKMADEYAAYIRAIADSFRSMDMGNGSPDGFAQMMGAMGMGGGTQHSKAGTSSNPKELPLKALKCTLFPRGLCRLEQHCPWAHSDEERLLAASGGASTPGPESMAWALAAASGSTGPGLAQPLPPALPPAMQAGLPTALPTALPTPLPTAKPAPVPSMMPLVQPPVAPPPPSVPPPRPMQQMAPAQSFQPRPAGNGMDRFC